VCRFAMLLLPMVCMEFVTAGSESKLHNVTHKSQAIHTQNPAKDQYIHYTVSEGVRLDWEVTHTELGGPRL